MAALATLRAADNPRVVLTPKFVAGQTMTYEIETETTTAGKTVTPIINNEGATQASLKISLRERLQVLGVHPEPGGDSIRFRLAWEESGADAMSDTVDPSAADPSVPFVKLKGQFVDLTLAPDGGISNFAGLENVLPGGVPPAESVAWISSLVAPAKFPSGGILIGQQWKSERAIGGAPLAGLFWQTESTYQRNEPCAPASAQFAPQKPGSSPVPQQCAVIISRMSVDRHGSPHSDATPDEYLHEGLRTSGTWTGSGQELGSIAIPTGLLVSATESSSQDVDYEIKSASTGSAIHYTAKVQSQTVINLVDPSQMPPAKMQ